MLGQSPPLFRRKFETLPVVAPVGILGSETDPERLIWAALVVGIVRLKFDGVSPGVGNRIDISVCRAKTTVMGLSDLANN